MTCFALFLKISKKKSIITLSLPQYMATNLGVTLLPTGQQNQWRGCQTVGYLTVNQQTCILFPAHIRFLYKAWKTICTFRSSPLQLLPLRRLPLPLSIRRDESSIPFEQMTTEIQIHICIQIFEAPPSLSIFFSLEHVSPLSQITWLRIFFGTLCHQTIPMKAKSDARTKQPKAGKLLAASCTPQKRFPLNSFSKLWHCANAQCQWGHPWSLP